MIYSEDELNRLFANKIALSVGGAIKKPTFGVPEEEVVNRRRPMPFLSLFYLWDELSEQDRLTGHYYLKSGTGSNTVYRKMEMPEPVKFYYQLDIYSQTQENLVQLSTELSKVIKRRGSYLIDTDGDAIAIERTDVQDFSRDSFRLEKSEERIFRRTYTFSLRCYFQPQTQSIATYGPVLATEIIFEDLEKFKEDYP